MSVNVDERGGGFVGRVKLVKPQFDAFVKLVYQGQNGDGKRGLE